MRTHKVGVAPDGNELKYVRLVLQWRDIRAFHSHIVDDMCLQCAGVTSPDCPSDLASDGLSFESIESCAVGGDGCESISALQRAPREGFITFF